MGRSFELRLNRGRREYIPFSMPQANARRRGQDLHERQVFVLSQNGITVSSEESVIKSRLALEASRPCVHTSRRVTSVPVHVDRDIRLRFRKELYPLSSNLSWIDFHFCPASRSIRKLGLQLDSQPRGCFDRSWSSSSSLLRLCKSAER